MRSQSIYNVVLTVLYSAIVLMGALHHEIWLDEAQHWLLARDSHSITELIVNTSREGHPLLWSTFLYVLTRFTSNPLAMQLLNVAISAVTVAVFLTKAPFNKIFKLLFIFGYFMVFEYSLIARNYMLGVLFLMLACSCCNHRQTRFALICFWLALAANVHLMFAVPAIALFLVLVWEQFKQRRLSWQPDFILGYVIFVAGMFALGWQILRTDSGWFFETLAAVPIEQKFNKGVMFLYKGLFALPDFSTLHFWNTNFSVNFLKPIAALFAVLTFALPLLLFESKKVLVFVYFALAGAQMFFLITQRGAMRFDGLGYLIVLSGLWLDAVFLPEIRRPKFYLLKNIFVYGILSLQLLSGATAYFLDWNHPFSGGKNAIDFVKEQHLDGLPVVSLTCDGSIISAYLERKVWFLCNQQYSSFCHWETDFDCAQNIRSGQIITLLAAPMTHNRTVIYISNFNLEANSNSPYEILLLKKFDDHIVANSNYYIFKISKK